MASHIQNALIQSPYSSPDIQYKVSYSATRIDNSNVRYDFTIKSLLQGSSASSFKNGKILDCTITVGGVNGSARVKDTNEVWSGGSGGTTGEGALKSTEYISITCPSSSGGEWQTVTFNVTRGDSGGNSGKVSTSDYYVISPDLLWTAAGGATVNSITANDDNTLTVVTTMGADGHNNKVSSVHIYGFVNKTTGTPRYPNNYDFGMGVNILETKISGKQVTFKISAPSTDPSYMVRICAYSISQQGDNPGGTPVNSGTIYRRYTITFDPNGGTLPNPGINLYNKDNPENKVIIPYNAMMYAIMPDIPTRPGYIFNGWNTKSDGSGTQVYDANGSALGEGTYYTPGERWVYAGDVILYAIWESIAPYLIYVCENGKMVEVNAYVYKSGNFIEHIIN